MTARFAILTMAMTLTFPVAAAEERWRTDIHNQAVPITRSDAHKAAGVKAAATITSPVLLTIGMSNTSGTTNGLAYWLRNDKSLRSDFRLVNGAQSGETAVEWSLAEEEWAKRFNKSGKLTSPWRALLDSILPRDKVTPDQIQAIYVMTTVKGPRTDPEANATLYHDCVRSILQRAQVEFPQLKIAYIAGNYTSVYCNSSKTPEPHNWRENVELQAIQDRWNDPRLWVGAISLWTDGDIPRYDGFAVPASAFTEPGVHMLSEGYRDYASKQLYQTLLKDPTTRPWMWPAGE